MGGKKFDNDKIRYDLIPPRAEQEIAKVLTGGAQKYDPWNWLEGINFSRLRGAERRHMACYDLGKDVDPEFQCRHLAHAIVNLMFLLEFQLLGRTELDDRPKKILINPMDDFDGVT